MRFLDSQNPDLRLVVAGYSLRSEHLQSIVGKHHLVTVSGRKYTLERCQITSTGNKDALLLVAVDLTLAALNRVGDMEGNVIVFLPGWHEMCQVQKAFKKVHSTLKILMLHSDVIGNESEDLIDVPKDDGRVVALSTVIGARSITIPFPPRSWWCTVRCSGCGQRLCDEDDGHPGLHLCSPCRFPDEAKQIHMENQKRSHYCSGGTSRANSNSLESLRDSEVSSGAVPLAHRQRQQSHRP